MNTPQQLKDHRSTIDSLLEGYPKLDVRFHNWNLLDSGNDGNVYRVGEDLVAKTPILENWRAALRNNDIMKSMKYKRKLEREARIARGLHNLGISVPEPRGVFRVEYSDNEGEFIIPGFVMEFIDGISLEDMGGEAILTGAREKYMEEIAKAEKAGFILSDHGTHNTIYAPKTGQVYLIDFMDWGYEGDLAE